MAPKVGRISYLFLWLVLMLFSPSRRNLTQASGGKWDLLLPNIGISAMHMQLLNNDRVVMYDRTDFGYSNISLPNGKCITRRDDPKKTTTRLDCTAHSVEYDVATNSIRPLTVLTDVWCSSGSAVANGSLIQTGGFNEGEEVVRRYKPCKGCDWEEINNGLIKNRWYATNHHLPDGRQIIIGGRAQFNYEFYPKVASADQPYDLPFLAQTNDAGVENNLYPFVFLNVDGNLFIFANNRAILFDYEKCAVVRTYPQIPGGEPRSYPSTGSAVVLPLKNLQASSTVAVEVLVCGGAPKGAYTSALNGNFIGALKTCARINANEKNPQWTMETMPLARVMGDMLLLPNGNVLIINGAGSGTAGWELGRNPVLSPVIYRPNNPVGSRFEVQNPSKIPRVYHSTAVLLRDGRVLVGGSNPHDKYAFSGVIFPTELSLEAYSPSYLESSSANLRPNIILPGSDIRVGYKEQIMIQFTVPGTLNANLVKVTMLAPPFNTHSFSMNQRLLELSADMAKANGRNTYEINVTTPPSGNLAPSGYYLLFVVHQDIPSVGIWVQLM